MSYPATNKLNEDSSGKIIQLSNHKQVQQTHEATNPIPTEKNSIDSGDNPFQVIPPLSCVSKMSADQDISAGSSTQSNPSGDAGGGLSNSFQGRTKKSGGLLSKLQSSSEDKDNGNSVSSSIANAFSSISSFTSNFTLNSTSQIDSNSVDSLTIETATSNQTKSSQAIETREDVFIKRAVLERKNLINLTVLIVKDLISSSLKASRTIDNDCHNVVHLNNYFTLIDRVLKHGLKQNILSTKSTSLWNALDVLPKYLKESTLISESVRSLTHTKSPDGKIKAWMRLAMMQKKLPEYFSQLLANKNVLLKDVYHDYAFMLNDEAHVFAGLIIGVNVIDCNFFVKDANFDMMDDIIDLSPYLKASNSYEELDVESRSEDEGIANLRVVLDQKNYLEERNKRLETVVEDLQSKIKILKEHNSKLEMEARVSEARIQRLQSKTSDANAEKASDKSQITSSITDTLKNLIVNSDSFKSSSVQGSQHADSSDIVAPITENKSTKQDQSDEDRIESESKAESQTGSRIESEQMSETSRSMVLVESSTQLKLDEQEKDLCALRERVSILEASYRGSLERIKMLERDLDIQTSLNVDKENTIKIYERDLREKQNTIETLRSSIADAKKSHSELSERFNETNAKLKDRIMSVSNLQASLDKWKLENKNMSTRLQDKQTALKSVNSELEKAFKTIAELKKYNEKINNELTEERESGQSSSVTLETQNSRILELEKNLNKLEGELKLSKPYKNQTEELSKRCKEYELSLEEIGAQLRESRLEVENLKENSAVFLDSTWMDEKTVKSCALCQQSFSVTRRKHHCRLCGNVFCQTCSDNKMELASSAKPVRVCDTCHAFLLDKYVKSSALH